MNYLTTILFCLCVAEGIALVYLMHTLKKAHDMIEYMIDKIKLLLNR